MGVRGLVVGEDQQSAVLEMAVWRVLTMRWGGRLNYLVPLCYQTGSAEVTYCCCS